MALHALKSPKISVNILCAIKCIMFINLSYGYGKLKIKNQLKYRENL